MVWISESFQLDLQIQFFHYVQEVEVSQEMDEDHFQR